MTTSTPAPTIPEQSAYSIKQAAQRLGVSDQFVRNLIADGRLKAKRDGKPYFIKPEAIEAYLDSLPSA